MDFGDGESLKAAQELELSSEDVKGGKIELRFVRFQNVRSLHLLVKDNQDGEETTRIDSLDIFGSGEGHEILCSGALLTCRSRRSY